MVSQTFGGRLKEIRCAHSMTQAECAEKCNMQPSQWSNYETGERHPSLGNMREIALGMNLEYSVVGWLVVGAYGEIGKPVMCPSSVVRRRLELIRKEVDALLEMATK